MPEKSEQSVTLTVEQVFAMNGPLHLADPHFKSRALQTQFAVAVQTMIRTPRGKLVVEAGTGTGKTYAYLVPVLLSGKKTIISTATKGLQDQLFLRDLPHVRKALKVAGSIALLKGRSNYLCPHRLDLTRNGTLTFSAKDQRDLAQVILWSQETKTGDTADLVQLGERSAILPLVTSTRDNCLGSECPQFQKCYLMQARKKAMEADIVVVNHHLFFADLAVRESGVAELLPTADVVIFDEAHQLNDAGLQFLGVGWTTAQGQDFIRDMLTAGLTFARSAGGWQEIAESCEQAIKDFRLLVKKLPANARIAWEGVAPNSLEDSAWNHALTHLIEMMGNASDALKEVAEQAPDLTRLHQRATQLKDRLIHFNGAKDPKHIRWIETGNSLRLIESPLNIADAMQQNCFGGAQSWVFTSATLGDDESLSWFTKQVGLLDAEIKKLDSPFDYPHQAAIYVPESFPRPQEQDHLYATAHLAARLIETLGGRAFVLTTTLKAFGIVGEELKRYFEENEKDIEVLVQGTRSKRDLIEQFRHRSAHSVLVGSQSFWEGVDVAGDDLQLVIIDKLPFPPPNDPLIQARANKIEAEGGNAFMDLYVPEAAVSLKQGAGRLIRLESDRGVLVICDPRLSQMGYGKRLLKALPPMQRIRTFDAALSYVKNLA